MSTLIVITPYSTLVVMTSYNYEAEGVLYILVDACISCRFTLTYSNNMTFATIKVTLAFLICLDAQAGSNQVPFGCCRVAGTPRRSTSPRGASPCSADGYLANHSSTPKATTK